ncbi:stalk domain-containing protein [Desulfofundulus thermocisternus]|jgi:iron complex transport system substrate-binding protein|uniref:stalk domain-containing protein n=1 Tax=Desulfofundulus thermocisternus TaxID=42471 RepID=UPI0004873AF3|nr:ABC transporter substrate-binding protein [Desulfofundulus thermocisternus]
MLKSKKVVLLWFLMAFIFALLGGKGILSAEASAIAITIDGERLSCDAPPVTEQGRTLVPLRAIFEALGARVEWDDRTRTVTGIKGGTTIKLVIDQRTAYVNGKPVTLDVPGKILSGRTMVPLRFIGESLGAKVDWNETKRTVIIVTGSGSAGSGSAPAPPKRITIKDSHGRTVRVPCPPQRVVSVNSDVTELIYALGEEKRIVGVADTADFPPVVKRKVKVGKAFTPSVEKILALKPDVVFGYGGFLKPEIIAQIERAGIPVVLLDCYNIDTMAQDIRTLGTILNRQKEAAAYLAYFEKYQKLFKERTKNIPLNKRPRVYLEGYTDYSAAAPGSGGAQMLDCVGGRNICAALRQPYPKVNAEWVVAQNPQVIIKACSTSVPSGYGENADAMKMKHAEMMRRPGWNKITAVQQGKVYMLSSEIYTGPRAIVGLAYFAKWIYPELFRDVDPEAIHKEMLKKFHGIELKGAYAYPAK